MGKYIKFTVNVPLSHCDDVRKAMGDSEAGKIGSYGYCSFSVRGVGRCVPMIGSKPWSGKIDTMELIEEEKIESFCSKEVFSRVLEAIKRVHPYEEPAISYWEIDII